MNALLHFIAQRHKAIAGFVAPLVVAVIARYVADVDVDAVTALISAVLSGLAVHTVTNAPPT